MFSIFQDFQNFFRNPITRTSFGIALHNGRKECERNLDRSIDIMSNLHPPMKENYIAPELNIEKNYHCLISKTGLCICASAICVLALNLIFNSSKSNSIENKEYVENEEDQEGKEKSNFEI